MPYEEIMISGRPEVLLLGKLRNLPMLLLNGE